MDTHRLLVGPGRFEGLNHRTSIHMQHGALLDVRALSYICSQVLATTALAVAGSILWALQQQYPLSCYCSLMLALMRASCTRHIYHRVRN